MNYQCKCGSMDMFVEKKGNNTGLYCSMCGKFQKWINKEELKAFEHNKITKTPKYNNIKDDINEFIDFLDEEIDRQFEKDPLSVEDSLSKCSYATALERVKLSLINIVDGRRYNEYE